MKANKKYKWLILPALAGIIFGLTLILRQQPRLVETWYARGIYPQIAALLSNVSSIFPFSLDDVLYVVLLLMPVALIVRVFTKSMKWKNAGKFLLNILAAAYILFYVLWGFNYFRSPLQERLELQDREPNTEEFVQFIHQYIQEVNALHCSFDSMDKKNVDELIEASYKELAPALHFDYPMGKRPDKQITFSGFYAKSGITGYFGPFFNEVHVNQKILPIEYPFVLAHEKAHQLGVTSEAEANFYSWLVCSNSSSQQIRYSANLFISFHFFRQSRGLEAYQELVAEISPEVQTDINKIREHWNKLRNATMDKTASKLNDAYLKHNNIKSGIKDYTGVVDHVMNFSLDSAFQQRYDLAPH
ncbi:DUF3810 domain-containing protein [Draconibacterium halophilum]|uniref:DUF3810 domain-containing protein n=1 Tax=Draconibacterium halophilum TaxID=2706887 RepID=A0A6C0R820_9BACT|nr:DUF3810 domain-containing protein [Draconibacterium halophilum]QIA06269.1 DUF3810 domain-containing protein [Draconibacterium halophilum]